MMTGALKVTKSIYGISRRHRDSTTQRDSRNPPESQRFKLLVSNRGRRHSLE
jgi:hypothetical protein